MPVPVQQLHFQRSVVAVRWVDLTEGPTRHPQKDLQIGPIFLFVTPRSRRLQPLELSSVGEGLIHRKAMPSKVASPHWFSETFGFAEDPYDKTREKFVFADDVLESKVNGRRFFVGPWSLPSVAELRSQCAGAPRSLGGLTFSNVCGNAQTMHRDAGNEGSVFQVASQFNCLEMNEPGARPEDGVTRYYSDATQGPACAISCPAGTVFRNYFVTRDGP